MIKQYKFLRTGLNSENGNLKWKTGEWQKVEGELDMCSRGLHSCKDPYDAFSYVQGEILAIVECRGEHLKDNNKYCWREQRVIKTYKWTKKDSVRLAIYSAELCLPNYEKLYKDKAPRLAIKAAKRWLKTGSRKGLAAAGSAVESAVWSAGSAARSAAESAAWSAGSAVESAVWSAGSAVESAARSAESAVESAAWSAGSAARSAESAGSAVESAAWSAAIKKIQRYFKKIVKGLKPL
jgi:hypothetical protein